MECNDSYSVSDLNVIFNGDCYKAGRLVIQIK